MVLSLCWTFLSSWVRGAGVEEEVRQRDSAVGREVSFPESYFQEGTAPLRHNAGQCFNILY
jgi:hypothetical protein